MGGAIRPRGSDRNKLRTTVPAPVIQIRFCRRAHCTPVGFYPVISGMVCWESMHQLHSISRQKYHVLKRHVMKHSAFVFAEIQYDVDRGDISFCGGTSVGLHRRNLEGRTRDSEKRAQGGCVVRGGQSRDRRQLGGEVARALSPSECLVFPNRFLVLTNPSNIYIHTYILFVH